MKRKILCAAMGLMFLLAQSAFAGPQYHYFFSGFDVDLTTLHYTAAGGTLATSGQIDVSSAKSITIYAGVTTLASTSITIYIEGRSQASSATWARIYSKTYSAAVTSVTYDAIPVTEDMYYLRVGTAVVGDAGTDALTVLAVIER